MPAPAFVSATAQTGAPTTAPSVTLPTTAANDILILVRVNGGTTGLATPGGTYNGGAWNSISPGTWVGGAGDAMWSRATGNHSGQTVTMSTSDSGSALIVRVSGCVTSGSPLDTNISAATTGMIAGGALAGFNTTVADTLVCYTGAGDDNQTASSPTKNGVAMSNLSAATSAGGQDSGVFYANAAQAAAGATGSFAVTWPAVSGNGKQLIAFALKPPPPVTFERSAAIDAAAAITAAGAGFTIESRSAAIAATAEVASVGAFFSVESRSAAIAAAAVLIAEGETAPGFQTLERSAALDAIGEVSSLGIRFGQALFLGPLALDLDPDPRVLELTDALRELELSNPTFDLLLDAPERELTVEDVPAGLTVVGAQRGVTLDDSEHSLDMEP